MQIIVSPVSGGDNFLLDVDASSPVEVLRSTIALRLNVQPEEVKLVCEGLELADGASLAEYFIQPLSTIRVVVAQRQGAGLLPAAQGEDEGQVISDAEMVRAIVVTGMPEAEAAATESAVYDVFARYGEIARLIFQGDGQGRQHAVLVYHREPSAAAALAATGTNVLGRPVNVMLANNLAGPRGAAGARGGAAGGPPQASKASDVIADLLAKGVLFGVQGVAHVRRFDEANGLSHRVSVVAEQGIAVASTAAASANAALTQVDQKYRVRESLASTYETARTQVQELDTKYKLTEKAKETAKAALAQANVLASRAMANPQVASAVTSATAFFHTASAAASQAFAQAKADIGHIEHKLTTAASTGGMPASGAAPAGGSAGGGAGQPSLPSGQPPFTGHASAAGAGHAGVTHLEDSVQASAGAGSAAGAAGAAAGGAASSSPHSDEQEAAVSI